MRKIFEYLEKISDQPWASGNLFRFSIGDKLVIDFNLREEIDMVDDDCADYGSVTVQAIDSVSVGCIVPYDDFDGTVDEVCPFTYLEIIVDRELNKHFPGIVLTSSVDIYSDDTCMMCPFDYYGFSISISDKYWADLAVYKYLCSLLEELEEKICVPHYYREQKRLSDDCVVNIIATNTKARRLGYLKILLCLFKEKEAVSISTINRTFEKYAQKCESDLMAYKNNKGRISVTRTGISASPYVDLAVALGLIQKIAGYYKLGKAGRVLSDFLDISDNINPFILTELEQAFFFELLLKSDGFYLYLLFEHIFYQSNDSYASLKQDFKERILKKIQYASGNVKDSQKKLRLLAVEKRVHDWKNPQVYLEHILMPRLNWLYDLDMIELKEGNTCSLTPKGERMFYHLSIWNDLNVGAIVNFSPFVENYYIKATSDSSNISAKEYTCADVSNLDNLMRYCFNNYKTLAPNRTTFSMASNYIRYSLLFQDKCILEESGLKATLEGDLSKKYTYRYQRQYKDGYIQNKRYE